MSRETGSRARRLGRLSFCLLVSAVMLGLCSRSSPLYPLNDWVDVNCFFTVGKAMFNGRVVYRDIYEQKGVLLYFLYGLGWLISHTSFLGVFLLEVCSMSCFLALSCRTAELYVSPRLWALFLPGLAAILCSSYAFFLGGSVEQLALPLLYLPLHSLIESERRRGDYLPEGRRIVALGAAAGCLLWMKFSLLGIYLGYVLYVLAAALWRREFRRLLCAAGLFLLGVLTATLPWLLYFGAHRAIGDCFTVYFYNNIVLYPQREGSRLAFVWENLRNALLWNARMALLIGVGGLATLFSRRPWGFRLGMLTLYVCGSVFLYLGGAAYDYYAFALAALTVPGAIALARLAQALWRRLALRLAMKQAARTAWAWLLCLLLVAGGGCFARAHSINSFYTAYDRESMWYSRFAERIAASEEQSLLNYGFLDLGMYTVTGSVPETRFFCVLNLDLPEMRREMEEAVRERKCRYIVTVAYEEDPLLTAHYRLLEKIESFYEFEDVPMCYYLLERR